MSFIHVRKIPFSVELVKHYLLSDVALFTSEKTSMISVKFISPTTQYNNDFVLVLQYLKYNMHSMAG